jgi:hypothetical protein
MLSFYFSEKKYGQQWEIQFEYFCQEISILHKLATSPLPS